MYCLSLKIKNYKAVLELVWFQYRSIGCAKELEGQTHGHFFCFSDTRYCWNRTTHQLCHCRCPPLPKSTSEYFDWICVICSWLSATWLDLWLAQASLTLDGSLIMVSSTSEKQIPRFSNHSRPHRSKYLDMCPYLLGMCAMWLRIFNFETIKNDLNNYFYLCPRDGSFCFSFSDL